MTASHKRQCGFTLIELIAVICILSILASLALIAYNRVAIDRYDAEAIATLSAIGEHSLVIMSDWGVGRGISEGCTDLSVAGAGSSDAAVTGISNAGKALGFKLEGPQHWFYQVCFGTDDNGTEIYIVSAHRIINGSRQRVLVAGSGFAAPVVAYADNTTLDSSDFETPSTETITDWTPDKSSAIEGSGE